MQHQYKTSNVCSTRIQFDLIDGKLHNVRFTGGCNGNLKAIGKLVEGKDAAEVAALLKGNTCGFKSTSCTDQLSKAIEQAIAK
ncbi:MAG: TIGR03905 family TSCPD domain-containing protein [Clostridia bacterium]